MSLWEEFDEIRDEKFDSLHYTGSHRSYEDEAFDYACEVMQERYDFDIFSLFSALCDEED